MGLKNVMNRIHALAAAALLLAGAGLAGAGLAGAQPGAPVQGEREAKLQSEAVESASGKVSKALVRIHVVEARYDDGRSLKTEASGSGAIITPDGYIVTNHHVAGDAGAPLRHDAHTARRSPPNWSAPTPWPISP